MYAIRSYYVSAKSYLYKDNQDIALGNGAVNLPPETISDNNNTIPNPDLSWLKTDITNFIV